MTIIATFACILTLVYYRHPMYPILRRYGPFFLYSYTVAMGVGLLLALGLTAYRARRREVHLPWLDGFLLSLFAGLAGGRLAYVAANWSYYQAHLSEAWLVWRGGLSYHGALAAGLVALWAWCRWQDVPFARVAGLLAPGLALGSAFGWLACYLEGCAYGRETFLGLLASDLPDSYGVYAVRYQTQLAGLLLSVLALLLLWAMRRRLGPLALFWLALFLLSAGRFAVSLIRGDAVPLVAGFRLDTLLDGTLTLLSAIALLLARRRKLDVNRQRPAH